MKITIHIVTLLHCDNHKQNIMTVLHCDNHNVPVMMVKCDNHNCASDDAAL